MGRTRPPPPLPGPRAALRARVARAHGHLHGILDMIDDKRPHPEVLQQLGAVRAALDKAMVAILDELVDDLATNPRNVRRPKETLRAAVRTLV